MHNLIHYVNDNENVTIEDGDFLVEIDGITIPTKEAFLTIMEEVFRFPYSCNGSYDAFYDFMRDLSWIECQGFVLVIKNYPKFLANRPGEKEEIINSFEDTILPFWSNDVIYEVIGGSPKKFEVYLKGHTGTVNVNPYQE